MSKICRFYQGGNTSYGLVEGRWVRRINNPFEEPYSLGEAYDLDNVRIEAPCEPTKVICVGLNYRDHAIEMGLDLPGEPLLFLKPPSSVLRTGGNICYPETSKRVDYEAELAIVIGRQGKNISIQEADKYVLGYTCANDVTARDLQKYDVQWTRAKSFDGFLPLGPYIVNGINPDNLGIELYLNGQIKQKSNTCKFIFNTREIISYASQVMTLMPGDVILTGTPSGVGPLKRGDKVEVCVESVGTLTSFVE